MRSRLTLLGVAAATLAVAACAQDELMNPLPPDGTEATAVDLAEVVATIDRENGGAVVILDMGDGEIGIVERESVDPRILAGPSAGAGPLADPGYDFYACDSWGTEWVADWKAAFVGITKYRAAAYPHNYAPPYTFYPGAPVYYGTNTNSITYLGACNGDSQDDLTWKCTAESAARGRRSTRPRSRVTRSTRSTVPFPRPTEVALMGRAEA